MNPSHSNSRSVNNAKKPTQGTDQSENTNWSHDPRDSGEPTSKLQDTAGIKPVLMDIWDSLSKISVTDEVKVLQNNDLVSVNKVLTDIQGTMVAIQSKIVTELRDRCSSTSSS